MIFLVFNSQLNKETRIICRSQLTNRVDTKCSLGELLHYNRCGNKTQDIVGFGTIKKYN